MKKLLVLTMLLTGVGIHIVKAQYWIPNFVEPEYVTKSSTQGISVSSITTNYDGSLTVKLSNDNGGSQGCVISYSFEWYLSYKGKRVSDYFQETIECGRSTSRNVFCWPGEVPSGNEKFVTVQLGREPAKRDPRDDD